MSGDREALLAHLSSGITTVCRAWEVRRADGSRMGFCDHDADLTFDDLDFRADSGMTAQALAQSTGLAVDNTEAIGALRDDAITEEDIAAGLYDGADVLCWLVNWQAPEQRMILFRGSIGEIVRAGGSFRADLRGLSEALNVPMGRVYQRSCSAVLGDSACGVDLDNPDHVTEQPVQAAEGAQRFVFGALVGFDDGWFAGGRVRVVTGAAAGLTGQVKSDRSEPSGRAIELWQALGKPVQAGDILRIEAGCDKQLDTCRAKFANVERFRGFPYIPGDDWVTSYPKRSSANTGRSYLRYPHVGN